jgi:hypothetical protein
MREISTIIFNKAIKIDSFTKGKIAIVWLIPQCKRGETTMRKRMLAIVLCLVMVSVFPVTSAVSAAPIKQAGKSTTYFWEVYWNNPDGTKEVVGKLMVNLATGHWAVSANAAIADEKAASKEMYPNGGTMELYLYSEGNGDVHLGTVHFAGGGPHGSGTVADANDLTWLATYGPGADYYFQ